MQPITLISSNYDLFVLNRKWQQLHHFCLHTLSQDWEDPDYGVSMNDRMGKTFDGQTDKLFWELDIWPAVKCFQHLGSFLWGQHSQHCEPLLKFGPGCIECSEPGKRTRKLLWTDLVYQPAQEIILRQFIALITNI